MTNTDLKLEAAGTLSPPGPVGRLVRLGYGVSHLAYVGVLLVNQGNFQVLATNGQIHWALWAAIPYTLFLVSYVINIGFSRAWKKQPAVASVALLIGAAGVSQLLFGTYESALMAGVLFVWLFYVNAHLGTAYVLSALLATPGCEMRAFHDLFERITGLPMKEHHCPIGPLGPIDSWEAKQAWVSKTA